MRNTSIKQRCESWHYSWHSDWFFLASSDVINATKTAIRNLAGKQCNQDCNSKLGGKAIIWNNRRKIPAYEMPYLTTVAFYKLKCLECWEILDSVRAIGGLEEKSHGTEMGWFCPRKVADEEVALKFFWSPCCWDDCWGVNSLVGRIGAWSTFSMVMSMV